MKTEFEGIKISARLKAEGIEQQNQLKNTTRTLYCNQFTVTLTYQGKWASFLFHGSHADYQNGKIELTEQDLKFALYCFVTDAQSGTQSFEDFCREMGYDEDSRNAERIHRACERSAAKVERLAIGEELQGKIFEQLG